MSGSLRILGAEETPFYGPIPGTSETGGWIEASIHSGFDAPTATRARVTARGRAAECSLLLEPGRHEYRVYAPVLWPEYPGVEEALLTLEGGGEPVSFRLRIGRHRPWTIHLLSDLCLDYTWAYATELASDADDVATTEAELRAIDASLAQRQQNQNRWNFAVGRELGLYLAAHGREENDRLIGRIQSGHMTLNPIPNMSLSAAQSFEELIRQLYPARRWERAYGIPIRFANHQETPTMVWTLASVLAGAGVTHLVKGLYPYGTPWCARLAEPPIFRWEGPDGAGVLVRRYNQHYVEGQFLLKDLASIRQALERKLLPAYEALGAGYPLASIGLVGCYGDLSHDTPTLAHRKASGIAEYNAQGWHYPLLVNASHETYWASVEDEMAARRIHPPVSRGDYGTGWEVWLLSLARLHAGWRRLQERSCLADRLAAVAGWLAPDRRAALGADLERGWACQTNLADHAWNGCNDANRRLNRTLRESWVAEASASFDGVIEQSLSVVAAATRTEAPGLLVFNGLGWRRTAAVEVDAALLPGGRLVDATTGEEASIQRSADGRSCWLVAEDLPPVGYRCYRMAAGGGGPAGRGEVVKVDAATGVLENEFYRIILDPCTGAIRGLFSKALGKELVDPGGTQRANAWIYQRDGKDSTAERASVRAGAPGPLVGELDVESVAGALTVATRIRLTAGLDRIEIENRVTRPRTSEREKLHFLFPFDVPDRTFRVELPGAVITAGEIGRGGEQLPGAGQAYQAVRHFADVSNKHFGVTVSQADSGFFQFGHRTEEEDPREPDRGGCALLAFVLDNTVNYAEATRDQGGATEFVFRFAIRAHGAFEPREAVCFAAEDNNEPLAVRIGASPAGVLPAGSASLFEASGAGIVLVAIKPAEEHPEDGIALRLWNTSESPSEAQVRAASIWPIGSALETDLLERPVRLLDVSSGTVRVSVPARGYRTIALVQDHRGG